MGDYLPFVNVGASGQQVTQVTAGELHTCVLLSLGGVKCWGGNAYGQLGLGISVDIFGNTSAQTGDGLPFVNLGTALTAVHVSAGYWHTCVILNGGTVKCWGFVLLFLRLIAGGRGADARAHAQRQ